MLPTKPMILPALLYQADRRPLEGPIEPGDVYAWEPDLPHARELLIVRRLFEHRGETWIEHWDMAYAKTHTNDEGRFREACVRTMFNPFPAERPRMILEPMPEDVGLFRLLSSLGARDKILG